MNFRSKILNGKTHAIDLFSDNGTKLSTNRNQATTIGYDFANDWVIISGLNHNMPMLRFTLKDHFYDVDLSDDYYHITDSTETFLEHEITINNVTDLAKVAKTLSHQTASVSYNITLASDLELQGKL